MAEFAGRGGPVLGVCNGFQVLCEAGLLPGVLRPQPRAAASSAADVDLAVEAASPWTGGQAGGATLRIPIKHHDGAWFVPDGELEPARRPAARCCCATREDVNGATGGVACVTNEAGNVCGLMPHPEHAVDALLGSTDGRPLLDAAARGVDVRRR